MTKKSVQGETVDHAELEAPELLYALPTKRKPMKVVLRWQARAQRKATQAVTRNGARSRQERAGSAKEKLTYAPNCTRRPTSTLYTPSF